ncbi:MAG TPA: hypothetical protein DEO86_03820 [Colwellia sp.]|mgnify:FL=1|jgi:hypothetical protein|nr:hypothetical protein [Colwellia sp.]
MLEINYPIKGACQCGQVTYQLLAAPLMVAACHCRECQKLSTSAFSITAVVNATDVVFSGEMSDWSRVADNGNTNGAKFCPCCGNRIYHFNPNFPDKIKLKPSTLEDTRVIQPTMHIWTSEKQAWFKLPLDLPSHEKQPF